MCVFIIMFPFGNTGHEPLCKKSFLGFLLLKKSFFRSKKMK